MANFKGFEKNCEVCGKLFRFPRSRRNPRTCSNECGNKIRNLDKRKEWISLRCACCGIEFKDRPCHAGRRKFCSRECLHKDEAHRAAKSEKSSGPLNGAWKGGVCIPSISKAGRAYMRQSSATECAKAAKRRELLIRATPAWANAEAMLRFYEEARIMGSVSGDAYHVDHIVPLSSKRVSGLHCEANLQVILGAENRSKSNRKWPDMP